MTRLRLTVNRYSSVALIAAVASIAAGVGLGAGCAAKPIQNGSGGSGASTSQGGSGASTTSTGDAGSAGSVVLSVGSGGAGPGCDEGQGDIDDDMDGYTEEQNDCNDCDPYVNPGAAEVVWEADPMKPDEEEPEPVDEDCDGQLDAADDDLKGCDTGLALDSQDALDAVRAIGFCDKDKDGNTKFLKSAQWVLADGLPPGPSVDMAKYHLGHGLLDHFGENAPPREGKKMLVLSSGTARNSNEPGFFSRNFDKGYSSNAPLTFSGESPACPGVVVPKSSVQDAAGMEIEVMAPTNAQSIEFSFNFFTYEFPQFVCTQFNDFFWANFVQGNVNKNVSFDSNDNAISVNAAFLSQCACPSPVNGECIAAPNPAPGQPTKAFKCDGVDQLLGTDFNGQTNVSLPGWTNGASGWLKTTVPVEPNKVFKLRFAVFDSGIAQGVKDHRVDSTVLIDKFRWRAIPGSNLTVPE